MLAWPGWYPYPGIFLGGPFISFGAGFGLGFGGGFGWGWSHWGFDWHGRFATYNNGRYASRSNTFYNRGNFYRGVAARGGNRMGAASGAGRGGFRGAEGGGFRGAEAGGFRGAEGAGGGHAQAAPGRGAGAARSGAFSGIQHGGAVRVFSSRGGSSFGGHHR
jgi:hypothetical protein